MAVMSQQPITDENESSNTLENVLLTPAEVAKLFRVDPKTVTRWASAGRIASLRTPGGHRRFWSRDVYAALTTMQIEDED